MPYTIKRNAGQEYCVHKADADGEPTGETLGCHDTRAKASAQIGAIESEEAGKMMMRPTQDEAAYVTLSATGGQACANCRWFKVEGEDHGMEYEGGYCHLIENYPENILPTGHCDRWEGKPEMPENEPLEVVIVQDERAATEPDPTPELDFAYAVPDSNKQGFLQSLKARLSGGLQPGQTVFRDTDGRRYMFIVTSNSYEDRENETIATKALQRYVDACWVAEDYFKSNNVHQVWHHDGLTVGDIVWADMSGPFLLEISKERDDIISKAAWDYWESEEGSKDLGASHRFLYRKQDKAADGTLSLISKFETTTLPRKVAAANLLTFSGVIPMSKSRDEYLDQMFKVEGVAELLKEGPQKLAAALEAAGVQHKSTDEPTPAEAVEKAEQSISALVLQMIETQAAQEAEIDNLNAAVEQKDKQFTDTVGELQTQLKALAADNKALQDAMRQSPRASEAQATEVTDDKLKTEIENKQVTYDPRFPNMQVPLEK